MPVETHPSQAAPRSASGPAEVVEVYFMEVYSACFRVLGRPQDAEDATQETFLSLFRSLEKLSAATSPRAWVLAVARNTAISMLRARRPEAPISEQLADAPPIREPGDRERLHSAIAELSEDDRALVQMRFLEGRSPAEMAQASGRPPGAVATALCRALKRLRGLYHRGRAR